MRNVCRQKDMLFRRIQSGSVILKPILNLRKQKTNCAVLGKSNRIWNFPHQWTDYCAVTLDLVKQIRDRAGLTTATSMDFASEDDIINYILDERQIELVGEGRRWFDLLRTKKWKEVMEPINGMNQDGNELFPIHYSHINENPKLTQNPYYGK